MRPDPHRVPPLCCARKCPFERVHLTIDVRDDLPLPMPVAHTDEAWIAFGFDEDWTRLPRSQRTGMLALMRRELGLERRDALALASVVVDLRVTQIVNEVRGVHALLRRDAIRFPNS